MLWLLQYNLIILIINHQITFQVSWTLVMNEFVCRKPAFTVNNLLCQMSFNNKSFQGQFKKTAQCRFIQVSIILYSTLDSFLTKFIKATLYKSTCLIHLGLYTECGQTNNSCCSLCNLFKIHIKKTCKTSTFFKQLLISTTSQQL